MDIGELLRLPTYIYIETQFILIGNFSSDDPEIFEVKEWEAVGNIERDYYILPIPSGYFNIWELNVLSK